MPARRCAPSFRAPRVERQSRPFAAVERLEGRALMSSTWAVAVDGLMTPLAETLLADGSMIVVGHRYVAGSGTTAAVAKLTPQGQLDTTFGVGGVATARWHGAWDSATDVVVTTDGKIVVSGFAQPAGPVPGGDMSDMGVARFNADGSLDATFGGGDGVAVVNVSYGLDGGADAAHALALDADGRVVLVGSVSYKASTGDVWWAGGIVAARLLPDGSLDEGFGAGGTVITLFAQPESTAQCSATSVQILDDGDILAGGYRGGPTTGLVTTVRYNADGTLDAAHGDGGILYSGDAYVAPTIAWPNSPTPPAPPVDEPPVGQPPVEEAPADPGPPAVSVEVPKVVSRTALVRRGAFFKFVCTYRSESGAPIDLSSLSHGDVTVSGPGGFSAEADLVRTKVRKHGTVVKATYRAAAPGGRFDATDNGRYALLLAPSAVSSTESTDPGTTGDACEIGAFLVSCYARPEAAAPARVARHLFSDANVAG